MPILDSHKKDILIFYIPGILSLIILNLFSEGIIFDWGLLIVAYYFADAGHVYTTVLRYKFDSAEKIKEVAYPFILFTVTIFTAIAFDVKAFWSLLIYATFLHNLKQAYGISSWYNLRSGAKKNNLKILFYSINCLSLLALHFRSDLVNVNSYPMLFIFRFPNPMLFKITFTLIGIGLVFLIWERFAKGKGLHCRIYPIFMTGI
ncbi:MAG: hypothetical protein NXH75_07530, partial [Halobacteriovoraceae bacterium]|nr:hypothetical protein [Halobacteriovoraceae bacterium]